MVLPTRLRLVLAKRDPSGSVIVARHPVDPCLRLHDQAFAERIDERLRLLEADTPDPFDDRTSSRRRLLAFAQEETIAPGGQIKLSAMMRAAARIGDCALLVCTGETIELWNPATARDSGDDLLVSLSDHYCPVPAA